MFPLLFYTRHGLIKHLCIKLQKKSLRRKAIKGLQITRETDYAIRVILYLSGKKDYFAKAEEIAQQMQIPKSFLRKILKQLEKKGLIQLKRGIKGGIRLLKPKEITLFDVIVAMEKGIALNRCTVNDKVCGLISRCSVHPVWLMVRQRLIQLLQEIKFHELAMRGTATIEQFPQTSHSIP